MLPATALQLLQSQLLAPATPTVAASAAGFGVARSNSDPLTEAVVRGRASFDEVAAAAGVRLSVPTAPAAANSMYATMMALQGGAGGGGGAYTASVPGAGGMSGYPGQSPRASLEYPNRGGSFDASSMRSSFDATGGWWCAAPCSLCLRFVDLLGLQGLCPCVPGDLVLLPWLVGRMSPAGCTSTCRLLHLCGFMTFQLTFLVWLQRC